MGRFPDNKRFAFTVFDDTDGSTVGNVGPVYRLLDEIGFLTTKSIWCLPNAAGGRIQGATLEDCAYRELIIDLQKRGFEIALHNVRNYDTTREGIELGFEQFKRFLGSSPRTHCNHDVNRENLYWGPLRIGSASIRLGYNLATGYKYRHLYEGHVEGSPYFWGDICKERIDYVRNFVFEEINLDRINPTMPYHDSSKPYVNFWFSSTEGGTVKSFCKTLSEANQDRLEAEGGVCIIYTHFAAGFCDGDSVHPDFVRLMRRLAKKNGWFVPVAKLLDHLRSFQKSPEISKGERTAMERRWLIAKLLKGTT